MTSFLIIESVYAVPVLQLLVPDSKAKSTQLAENLVTFLPVSWA